MKFMNCMLVICFVKLVSIEGELDKQRYAVTEEVVDEVEEDDKKTDDKNNGYEVYEVIDEGSASNSTSTPPPPPASANGGPAANTSTNGSDRIKWMLLPDGKGDVGVAILSGLGPKNTNYAENVDFYLYSRHNPTRAEKRTMNASCLPVFKYFKAGRPSKMLIHGFGDSVQDSIMYPILRDAFLTKGDYNIFLLDWSDLAATPWYNRAMRNTETVARQAAGLIDHLCRSTGAEASSFHLVGFSLGSHIAGMIGQFVKTGKIKRITALDPAQVLFTGVEKSRRLDETDAHLVEVVHTSGGYLGFQDPIGHRDIFPNGGSWPQPGCFLDYAAVCSHRRAYYYYGEAVRNKRGFRAIPCSNWPDYMAGSCKNNIENSFELANDHNTKKYRGKYFLNTNSDEPFGIIDKPVRETNTNDYDYFGILFDEFQNYVDCLWCHQSYFKKANYNLLSIDWGPLAKEGCYIEATHNVQPVGECVARMLEKIVEVRKDVAPQDVHVVGFSLGAHVAGYIGKSLTAFRITRITGLDPALPLFDNVFNSGSSLREGDADFVDVIHTNAGMKGKSADVGHVDFYANGGSIQPGCAATNTSCHHVRSVEIFAESINSDIGFYGFKCASFIDYMTDCCVNVQIEPGEGKWVLLGEYVLRTSRGQYYFDTSDHPLLAKGKTCQATSIL
ncbi:uncharacterized protein LOC111057670 [Nilaparvata lugens]|uniref:uncharacterized protein LOC111057670 n=1 Tax=Nilaparvata lugens TaxID=108931 RepID=UPI00193D4DA0|nr:uncharacterized protein LOC111057670 [Nilaparvata lugens]